MQDTRQKRNTKRENWQTNVTWVCWLLVTSSADGSVELLLAGRLIPLQTWCASVSWLRLMLLSSEAVVHNHEQTRQSRWQWCAGVLTTTTATQTTRNCNITCNGACACGTEIEFLALAMHVKMLTSKGSIPLRNFHVDYKDFKEFSRGL